MSRVFKFRAWVKDEMRYDVGVHPHISELHDDDSLTVSSSLGLFPIMQFTGLVDEKGKEIYEGDIVKWTAPLATLRTGEFTSQVYWSGGERNGMTTDSLNAWVLGREGKDGSYLLSSRYTYEVIGNIYENRDLLV